MGSIMVPDNMGGYVEEPPATVQLLAGNMLTALNKHYPALKDGWKVAVDTRGGIVQVQNLLISGKMGFALKITNVDPDCKNVVRLAGELLERYKISRNKNVDIVDAVNNLKRDNKLEAIHDKD